MTLEGRYLSLRMVGKKPTSLPAIGERKDQPRNHHYIDLLYFRMIAPYIIIIFTIISPCYYGLWQGERSDVGNPIINLTFWGWLKSHPWKWWLGGDGHYWVCHINHYESLLISIPPFMDYIWTYYYYFFLGYYQIIYVIFIFLIIKHYYYVFIIYMYVCMYNVYIMCI